MLLSPLLENSTVAINVFYCYENTKGSLRYSPKNPVEAMDFNVSDRSNEKVYESLWYTSKNPTEAMDSNVSGRSNGKVYESLWYPPENLAEAIDPIVSGRSDGKVLSVCDAPPWVGDLVSESPTFVKGSNT